MLIPAFTLAVLITASPVPHGFISIDSLGARNTACYVPNKSGTYDRLRAKTEKSGALPPLALGYEVTHCYAWDDARQQWLPIESLGIPHSTRKGKP